MRNLKTLCLLLAFFLTLPAMAKGPKYKYGVYLSGVSASFTDSLVYFTDIQYVDSAALGEKGLLEGRAQYSIQLKDYLEQKTKSKNRTCFIYFNKKKKGLQKEINKLKQKYAKSKSLVIRDAGAGFHFKKAELY